ncbi:TRAP transporter substrate-binding protein DctP [Pseudonocardia parietis]|uniref:TRAP-type C4-dicarboxylate transport system substrate-binding protein n=1 Tax=Pseudonocardia parietis TaxID=570936 RepID=A0ABS4VQJ8_9PSEU|nr:TRAP transporter substrate-binding protein DctP [Pseudonocardia parietis]MBP2366187.1 TRAP-type C4-dicarboxylate transport system substrate-binding protein [Pseudonocardia parietis]
MASFLSPTTAQGQTITWWVEELEKRTDGKVTVETFWDASLLGAEEIRDGVRDGRVELGNVSYAYTPSDFPLSSIVEVPFLGDNMGAQTSALNELYATDEAFRAEWEDKQGIKVMSFVGVPPALTGTKEPVTTVDWYTGKTVRASGFFVKALEAVGGNPAAIAVPETYEAMRTGTVEAYGGLILDVITPLSLHEVGGHIHDPGLGHYASSTWTMSLDTWNSLSPQVQGIIEELNAEFPNQLLRNAERTEDEACTQILDSGGSASKFDEAEIQKWKAAIGDAPMKDWIAKATAAGVADPAAMYERFSGLYTSAQSAEYADYVPGIERCAGRGR